ncbi:hypothetical protein DY000_02024441 [Brassica cretica]|uniref:Uncharacterized protein n=1 Tax=Brassica cretica TaxID=69181 RepID=A0ABQ7ELF5_BRACR|nr:hypothetical protein DY000_02024441 [Brassica cretica]
MTTIKYNKSKREQSRSYSEFAFEHYNKHPRVDKNAWTNCRIDVSEELGRYVAIERNGRSVARSLRSDRASAWAQLLRSDRASAWARSLRSDRPGRTLGRYVATERDGRLVAT